MKILAETKEEFDEILELLKPYQALTDNFEIVEKPYTLLLCKMKDSYEKKPIVYLPCDPMSSIEVGPESYRYFSQTISISGTKTKEQEISFQIRQLSE